MKKLTLVSLFLLLMLIPSPLCYGLEFEAITVFGCNYDGVQDGHARWNTGPVDPCWDIFIYPGDIVKNASQAKWMNDRGSHLVKFSPEVGSTTYTFHFECDGNLGIFGMNLFGPDKNHPLISVFAPLTRDAANPASFKVNHSVNTMGWPLSDVPAAGSLSCDGVEGSLWIHNNVSGGKKYTITDFKVLAPAAASNLDFVGPGEIQASGRTDYVGQFTIKVEHLTSAPQDWLLWLSTVAQMKIGTNNADGSWTRKYDYQDAKPPFSFTYDGKSSDQLLKGWKFESEHKKLDKDRTAHILTWQDPKTGLQVCWNGLEYNDYESIEWTIYLTNKGQSDTPLIENIKALDADLRRGTGGEYRLRHWNGTFPNADDFAPKSTVLEPGKKHTFRPVETIGYGRRTGTAGEWPYYNLETGDEGIIIAVSWAGRWYADFQREGRTGLHVAAGQETTHFKLLPGEKVRTPMIVMQCWKGGDWVDAQNAWRQWMIEHNIPKNVPQPPMFNACSSHQFAEMTKANEQNQIEFIDSYLAKGLKIHYWWMDAGWYVGAAEKGWTWTGTWEVDRRPERFPNGLRPISEHAHKQGVDIIVWFEPERVVAGTWVATEHPEWVLGGAGGGLLNMGCPEAWNWVVNHIDKIIIDEGIDLYRQDYNIDPLSFWQKNDTEDRQGITENKYVMGYLGYFDELLRRHPAMVIDACASGGFRYDLETMRRGVNLLRSDYLFDPVGQQGHTYGLSFWIPFHGTGYCPSNTGGWGWGTGGLSYNPYTRRSNMCPSNTGCFDFRVPVDDELIMKLYREWMEIGPDYYGNYYPLTDYSLSQKDWMGWQFDRPDKGEGFVQAFRRENCIFKAADLKMRGLDPDAVYQLKNYDVKGQTRATGKELMEKGISIEIPDQPGAVTIHYVNVK